MTDDRNRGGAPFDGAADDEDATALWAALERLRRKARREEGGWVGGDSYPTLGDLKAHLDRAAEDCGRLIDRFGYGQPVAAIDDEEIPTDLLQELSLGDGPDAGRTFGEEFERLDELRADVDELIFRLPGGEAFRLDEI